MTDKEIKKNLDGLLNTLKEVGVVLTEEQEKSIGEFVKLFEDRVADAERNAVAATKRVVERRLEAEYKTVFESLLKNMERYHSVAEKIRNAKIEKRIKEEQKRVMAEAVDRYLNSCLEEMITEKSAVDYNKLKKYETLFESMRDVMVEQDDSVKAYKKQIEKKYADENTSLIKENDELSEKLKKMQITEKSLREQMALEKAAALVEHKTRDLPAFEAEEVRKRLAGKTVDEVQKTFKGVLQTIREEMETQASAKEPPMSLDERISSIIEAEDDGAKPVEEESDKATPPGPVDDDDPFADEVDEDVTPIELSDEVRNLLEDTTEDNKKDDEQLKKEIERNNRDEMPVDETSGSEFDDDVELAESEKIDGRTMQFLIERYRSIIPSGGKNC